MYQNQMKGVTVRAILKTIHTADIDASVSTTMMVVTNSAFYLNHIHSLGLGFIG